LAKPGFIDGCAANLPAPALPPTAPLAMPRQRRHRRRKPLRPQRQSAIARLGVGLCRLVLALGTLALTAYGAWEMHGVLSTGGVTGLQWLFLVLFTVNFAWIGYAGCQAVLGFGSLIGSWLVPRREAADLSLEGFRTALLAPVYNEDPAPIAAMLLATAQALAKDAPGRFAVFVLSDTNRPDAWVEEERVFAQLVSQAPAGCPVHYRHRRDNRERKAGNIADWVMRWGGAYEAMLVVDADSVMAPAAIRRLAGRLKADPGLGLIQTLPAIMGGRSLYARLQQFAGRCYGPILAHGLACWHGRSSNFWGHNAIIRTQAFAEAARLPILPGKPPFGGSVLSHDFVEAALLRRAGWGVRFDPDIAQSYEEAPPSLQDVMVRDRRWAQGNLQHSRFLFARGLTLVSRLHLFTGIMSYVSALLWFFLVILGLMIAVQAALVRPEYFAEPSLFPTWPVFDSERALSLFVLSMGVVLTPKLLGWLAVLLNPRRCLRFGGPLALTLSLIVESLFSALFAPVLMVGQSQIVRDILMGRDSGWQPQRRRDGSVPFRAALKAHRWSMLIGVTLAGLAFWIALPLFYWLLPVTLGMMLAGPLAWLSASGAVGGALKRLAILRIPEEQAKRPAILDRVAAAQAAFGKPAKPAPALIQLTEDAGLRAWHQAQLPPADTDRFDPALVLARAKADFNRDTAHLADWLSKAEAMAFLNDPDLVARL